MTFGAGRVGPEAARRTEEGSLGQEQKHEEKELNIT